ncbi:MAG TPA: hypothetical protein VK041_02625 [Opitutales bacterium]|nr:hypothetical protein [Opitutales bacterium]
MAYARLPLLVYCERSPTTRSAEKLIMDLLEDIKAAIDAALSEKKKVSTIHSLVLIHAADLRGLTPREFCRATGLAKSYEIEFTKMIKASERLPELGYAVRRIRQ